MTGAFVISWMRHPRMVAWFLFITAAWILVRASFAPVYFLASVAEFTPGFILVPAAGLYAGPAGVAGIVAGTIGGDLLLGHWGGMTLFRVLAYGLGALYMMVLTPPTLLTDGHRGTRAIGLRLVPVCLTAAAWIAVGGALQRLYPFAYLLGINTAQYLVFAALLAPAALRLLGAHWAPRFGTWRDLLQAGPAEPSIHAELLIWAGALLACGTGALFSGWLYGVWPVGRPWLGLHTGAWVTGPVLASLALQLAGAALGLRRTGPDTPSTDGRFTRMYLPPIEKR